MIWIFFIFSLFSTLAKHSCQVAPNRSTESLNPIIILPASSRISYESLHYPVPAEQQYQVIPLVINTGKIPLINHAVQAPIQYFVPKSENRRSPIYESTQYLLTRDKRVQPNTETMLYSNYGEIENRPAYDHNNDPSVGTATVYSETRVSGQPASQGYSYGYKIIRGHVGDSNDRHDVPRIVDDDGPSSNYNTSRPHETDTMLKHITIDPSAKLQEANNERKTDKSKPRDNKSENISRSFKPIFVKTELNATETELKKYYKKVKNAETPINKAPNTREKLTTINPVQQ
ncbi:Uncharacterized protein FWK35_00011005 [Aphis craccivora]|uniref:Uncharacterized protein n=1 Tax=Aphis craccivora TaxID=307492 RepID=A0A6G0YUV8_APHCR|nr:Uncharacterized protein FWK35_00011005 [Aphis craccivora]